MNHQEITDHSLHLLVDGQLDDATRRQLEQQIKASPELQKKLKNIVEIKELVGLAYVQPQPVERRSARKLFFNQYNLAALAASLIMAIGLILGWTGHELYQQKHIVVANAARTIEPPRQQQSLQMELQHARKYMIHLDSYNPARLQKALLETRSLLDSYAHSGLPVKLDVLFDQQGIEILNKQHTAQIRQIKALVEQYPNLQFYACSKSIKLFLSNDKISSDIRFFHANQVVEELIPKRIEEGWVYIKA